MKRDELVRLLADSGHSGNYDEAVKLSDAILSWHEKELEPLRKEVEETGFPTKQEWKTLKPRSKIVWQAIKTVLEK